jgi:hypothetical protein
MELHSGSALRGKKVMSAGRSNRARTYQTGRTCGHPGCNTRLSVYNPSTTCALHTEATRSGTRRTPEAPVRREPEARTCAFAPCGRGFVTSNPARKYCSDACRMRAFQRRTAEARRQAHEDPEHRRAPG